MMRIQVRRRAIEELHECRELPVQFHPNGIGVIRIYDLIVLHPLAPGEAPFAEIEMKPNAERGMLPGVFRCFSRTRGTNHQARAREYPTLPRLGDAPVNTTAETEVIGVHDEMSRGSFEFHDDRPRVDLDLSRQRNAHFIEQLG